MNFRYGADIKQSTEKKHQAAIPNQVDLVRRVINGVLKPNQNLTQKKQISYLVKIETNIEKKC